MIKRKIIVFLMLLCFSFVINEGVKAQDTGELCFKPFSIFSEKTAPESETEDESQLDAEKTKKILKPKIVNDTKNPLNIFYAESVVDKAEFYIEEGDLVSAQEAIEEIDDWIYKATEFHTNLYKALSKTSNSEVQADVERDLAIQFAVLRDRALFLESQILTANGKNREAVENLVEVVRSQPKTELGFKAYQALQDMGFTYKFEYELIEQDTEKEKQKWF